MIFIIGLNARKTLENSFFMVLSISFFSIGIIDLFHTLSYEGMQLFMGHGSNLATQLWITARYVQALSLIFATIFINKHFNYSTLFFLYSVVTFILILIIFLGYFPTCYSASQGLTPFKIISEYVIIGILSVSIYNLYRFRDQFASRILKFIISAIIMTIISELFFTSYISVYGIQNFIGHIFKIVAFFIFYKAIIQIAFRDPVTLLYKKLRQSESNYREAYLNANFYKDLFTHDISNIFQIISSTVELAKIEGNVINEELISRLETQLKQGKELIRNIRKFSEIESTDLPIENLNVKKSLEDSIELLKFDFEDKTIEAQVISQEENVYALSNELVDEIFMNLLTNAVKYNNSDPIEIDVVFSNVFLENRKYVRIEMRDNGIGVPDDKKEVIFKKGHKREKGGKGLGFGLSVVRNIIKKLNGKIWVEDRVKGNPSKGSNFIILLPSA
jgi:signal transduction histidine kinase